MRRLSILCALLLIVVFGLNPSSVVLAERSAEYQISPRYSYTDSVSASLRFEGNYAICSGTITPSFTHDVDIIVTLYQITDSGSTYIASWSGSSQSGLKAIAGGRALVSSTGTFMVVVSGNVGGLEYPSHSVTREK